MSHSSTGRLFYFSLISTALITSFQSIARQDPSPTKLEHIEVTAQKRPRDMQDVPVAMSAITGKIINETASMDVFDIQGYVPAFSAFQSQSAVNSSFSIRGIGTSSQNYGFESSTGLYVDGVYRSRQNVVINDLVDIDTVEILRGPQGSLFGKNTPAGAVVFRTRQPDFENGNGFITATAGNDDLIRLSGATSINVIDNKLAARVSGFSTRRDGWINDTGYGENSINDRSRSGVRLQTLYTPSDDVSVRVIADYAELNEHCCGALTLQDNRQANGVEGKFGTDTLLMMPPFNATLFTGDEFYRYTTALSSLPESRMQDKGLSAEINWQTSPALLLTSITAWRGFDSFDQTDTDFTDADLLSTTNNARQQAFSQELRATWSGEHVTTIAGLWYFSQNLDLDFAITTGDAFPAFFAAFAADLQPLTDGINALSVATSGLVPAVAPATPGQTQFAHNAYQQQDSLAVFSQTDWQFAEEFTVTAGLRYTREDKTLTARFDEQGPGIDGLPTGAENTPDPLSAAVALGSFAQSLATGNPPDYTQLSALLPFTQAGWGYYFLGTASVLPRSDLDEKRNDGQLTGTLKLSWQPDNNSLWYASTSTGFKSGGMNTDRIAEGLSPQFNAEKATAYELGVKKQFPERNLRINGALHYTQIKDFQASTFTGLGFNLQNAGDLHTKGYELEIVWFPVSDTRAGLTLARTLTGFDDFEKGTCQVAYPWHTGTDDPGRPSVNTPYCSRTGDRLGFEPETSASLTLQHTLMAGGYPVVMAADYQYTGDLFLDDTNDPYKHSSSYALVNARVELSVPQWDTRITLWGRNLTNKEYIARNGFDVPVQAGKLMAYPGQPLSWGVTVTREF